MTGNNDFALGGVSAGAGIPEGGITSFKDWGEFAKAAIAETSYQTDHAQLEGVSALRMESLETTHRAVVAKQESARLYKDLKRQPVTSTLHEWVTQTSLGGQLDGLFNSETGDINSEVGEYNRNTMRIKYMMTQAQVSHVSTTQQTIGAGIKARENTNAVTRLVVGANRAAYHGDEKVSPNAVHGIRAQLADFNGGSNLIDAQAEGVTDANELAQLLFRLKADVQQDGMFGDMTHMYLDSYVQNDLDFSLFPQYRVHLDNNPNSTMIGAPVSGIRTSSGNVSTVQDMWINNPSTALPAYARSKNMPKNAPGAMQSVALAPQASVAGSMFNTERAGVYYYTVAPIDANGVEGMPSPIQSATVADGGGVEITPQFNMDNMATGWALYRSTQDPATAPDYKDMRLVGKFPRAQARYVDSNQRIAGASSIYCLNRVPESIQLAQLLPITQFPLYPTKAAVIPWAVLLYWAIQLGIPQHHFVIENYVPTNGWQPHKR